MARYSVQPRGQILIEGYEFLSFAKDMGKVIGKNVSKILSGNYSPGMLAMRQKPLDHHKQSATDAFKTTSKRAIPKPVEAIGDLIGNKVANEITRLSNNS